MVPPKGSLRLFHRDGSEVQQQQQYATPQGEQYQQQPQPQPQQQQQQQPQAQPKQLGQQGQGATDRQRVDMQMATTISDGEVDPSQFIASLKSWSVAD